MRIPTSECVMRDRGATPRKAPSNSGAVLMEYVVLCCGIALVLLEFMHTQFFNFGQGYVGLGHEWAEHVRIMHRAIALPIP